MKATSFHLALYQTSLFWENPEKNRTHIEKAFEDLAATTDLVVLPEMFTTGFSMAAATYAESMDGKTMAWLQAQAKRYDTAICGSLIIKDSGKYYNRFVLVSPEGIEGTYDKRHLFTMASEGEHYTRGAHRVVLSYRGWRILPQVCYDLRFPVFSRNRNDYDLLIYVANWPETRTLAWDALLRARGIENMSYCIGVNRIGTDGNALNYLGHSAVYDALGEALIMPGETSGFKYTTLDKKNLDDQRDALPFLKDSDPFTLS